MNPAAVAAAWLLEYRRGEYAAFPAARALALVERPRVAAIPGAPAHCVGLMSWEGRYAPILDLACMAYPTDRAAEASPSYALVLAWQSPAGWQPGALSAPFLAAMTQVSDTQQCEPLPDRGLLPHLACSWFSFEAQPTPVIDVDRLFCGSHDTMP